MTNSDNKMLSAPVLYTFDFERSVLFQLQNTPYGQNWPVVYILSNGSEAYVGETSNASQRIINHLDNKKRKNLKRLDLLYSQSFNKSAILDLEASLILCMTSDQKFDLQNRNSGQSQAHDYYQRQEYQNLFPKIWNLLRKNHLADSSLDQIYNSDLFKFSPYKTLTVDQFEIAQSIICSLLERIQDQADLNPDEQFAIQKDPIFVHGGAGTGKSVLGVYLAKTIADLKDGIIPDMEKLPDMAPEIQVLKDSDFKIGLVVPVNAFKKTLSKVFKSLKIRNIQVVSPVDAAKKKWDLLIVDESHRLKRRKNLTAYKSFDDTCRRLGLNHETASQLDWILACSRFQVFLYDRHQSVMPSDADYHQFKDWLDVSTEQFSLESQMRCKGGADYVDYIQQLFSKDHPKEKEDFSKSYDFKLFSHLEDMLEAIRDKEACYGLCRVIAGYAWKWVTKEYTKLSDSHQQIVKEGKYDILADGQRLIWNTTQDDWVGSPDACNEVGCIHTIQGYDLNYAGVLVGPDIRYDPDRDCLTANLSEYFDVKGKNGMTNEEDTVEENILRTYRILCTRGIRGTYIFAVDPKVRDYLKRYIQLEGQE